MAAVNWDLQASVTWGSDEELPALEIDGPAADIPAALPSPPLPAAAEDAAVAGDEASCPTEALQIYLSEVDRVPPWSKAEELELAVRIEEARAAYYRAVLSNPLGIAQLCALLDDASQGRRPLRSLFDVADLDEAGQAAMREELGRIAETLKREAAADSGYQLTRELALLPGAFALIETSILEANSVMQQRLAEVSLAAAGRHPERWTQRKAREVLLAYSSSLGIEPAALAAAAERCSERRNAFEGAKNDFTRRTLRLVPIIASYYRHAGIPYLDLIQEGNLGLLQAVERFDSRLGYRFSTYASWYIRQSIEHAILSQERLVRLPVRQERAVRRLAATRNELRKLSGREPTFAELAEKTELSFDQVARLAPYLNGVVLSIDEESEDGQRAVPEVPDASPSPRERAARHELGRCIEEALQRLSERERTVLRLRYGLMGETPHTLRACMKALSLSHEGVRRIETAALQKLRRGSIRILLADFV